MANKLFVGSLAFSATDDDLAQFFAAAGQVVSAKVIIDHDTNRSKGFGFVEMSTDEEAQTAIQTLDGKELAGRAVNVSEAKPRAPREGGDRNYSNNRYDSARGDNNRY
jgi:RNA recognition motif-containing protein